MSYLGIFMHNIILFSVFVANSNSPDQQSGEFERKRRGGNNEKALIGSIFIQRFSLFLFDYMIAEAVENRNKQFENNYAQNSCLPRPAGAPGKNPPVLRNRGIRTILLRTASAAGSHVFYSRIDTQDLRQLVSGDSPHYRKLAKCLMVRTI